ncbi:MAG: hypothetical protein DMC59_10155, partial [Verrucomicrobia bacterium]
PKRIFERLKEIIRRGDATLTGGALKTRPITRQNCKCSQPALRMIYWTRAAQTPCVGWQNEPL